MEIQVVTVLCIQITRGLPQSGLWICLMENNFSSHCLHMHIPQQEYISLEHLSWRLLELAVIEDTHVSSCPLCFLPEDTNTLRATTLLLSPVSLWYNLVPDKPEMISKCFTSLSYLASMKSFPLFSLGSFIFSQSQWEKRKLDVLNSE